MEGLEQLGDRLLALGQVAPGRLVGLFHPGVGQGQELLGVLAQRLVGELGEGADQALAVLLPGGRPLLGRPP